MALINNIGVLNCKDVVANIISVVPNFVAVTTVFISVVSYFISAVPNIIDGVPYCIAVVSSYISVAVYCIYVVVTCISAVSCPFMVEVAEAAGVFPSTTLGEQKRGFPSRFPSEAEFPERSRRGKPPPLEGCQSFFVPLGN